MHTTYVIVQWVNQCTLISVFAKNCSYSNCLPALYVETRQDEKVIINKLGPYCVCSYSSIVAFSNAILDVATEYTSIHNDKCAKLNVAT